MTGLLLLRWIHLVAAAVWTGGLIVLAALVMALRREGVDRAVLQATARQFARVSWTAMIVAIVTGLGQVWWMRLPWTYGRLHTKIGVVTLAVALALFHQLTARRTGPALRGVLQLVILLVSLGIFAAAVAL